MSWDGVQREILDALGYPQWRRVDQSAQIPEEPLIHALLRAAGRSAESADAADLCRGWLPVERLRSAGAKRALWPQLRALRGRSPQ